MGGLRALQKKGLTAASALAVSSLFMGCFASAAGPGPATPRPTNDLPRPKPAASEWARPTDDTEPIQTPHPTGTHSSGGPSGPTEQARVVSVTDGDTIHVDIDGTEYRLRYIGIDSPETNDPRSPVEWMGREASQANERLVGGKQVVLEKDVSDVDRFGRLLRYVWLRENGGWLMVNEELVRQGYAEASTYPPDVKYTDRLFEAMRDATDAGLGLWGAPEAPAPTPSSPAGGSGSNCDPSYPDVCIPPSPPDLDCGDISFRRFTVVPPDPHRFDGDHNGIGCESD